MTYLTLTFCIVLNSFFKKRWDIVYPIWLLARLNRKLRALSVLVLFCYFAIALTLIQK